MQMAVASCKYVSVKNYLKYTMASCSSNHIHMQTKVIQTFRPPLYNNACIVFAMPVLYRLCTCVLACVLCICIILGHCVPSWCLPSRPTGQLEVHSRPSSTGQFSDYCRLLYVCCSLSNALLLSPHLLFLLRSSLWVLCTAVRLQILLLHSSRCSV